MSEQATETGGIAADRLRSLIERIERLEEEKKAIASDINTIPLRPTSRGLIIELPPCLTGR